MDGRPKPVCEREKGWLFYMGLFMVWMTPISIAGSAWLTKPPAQILEVDLAHLAATLAHRTFHAAAVLQKAGNLFVPLLASCTCCLVQFAPLWHGVHDITTDRPLERLPAASVYGGLAPPNIVTVLCPRRQSSVTRAVPVLPHFRTCFMATKKFG